MTKMATTPIYGEKTFNTLLLQNWKADDLGTWYVALGMRGQLESAESIFDKRQSLKARIHKPKSICVKPNVR